MKILVINCGSSSLKFQLVETSKKFQVLAKGLIDAIGMPSCKFTFSTGEKNIGQHFSIKNHEEAVKLALETLLKTGVIKSFSEIDAVGHRAVHGGNDYARAVKIDAKVIKTIEKYAKFVPLHNPANLAGIKACKKVLPKIPHVAVFDTAFHQDLPEKAYLYGLPQKYNDKYDIRRYGFHGSSHKFVVGEAMRILKNKKIKIVSCHLGNGSSITASINGKSVDTSMGFSPLEGIMMGTRSGSIDPAIPTYLEKEVGMTPNEIWNLLNYESGLKGFSGISSDMRDIYKKYLENNANAILTIDTLSYQIAKFVGAYAAIMQGLDAIIFTGGIGENAFYIRGKVCGYLDFMGLKIDEKNNKKNELIISDKKSKVKVLVINTNEEKQIAIETEKTLKT